MGARTTRMWLRFGLAAVITGAPAAFAAEPPRHGLPLDCIPGETCWIVNYVDHDRGSGAHDYTCGSQTYDGHTGTDFAIRNLKAMAAGVPVVATTPGVVRRTREGIPDRRVTKETRESVAGRECGNGVVIDHGDGWETQFCHLRRGSLRVRSGDKVERGDRLGLVGLSGLSEFPHVHVTVRHQGKVIDPFVGRATGTACGAPGESLFAPETMGVLAYRPVSIYDAGIAGRAPGGEQIFRGEGVVLPAREAPALVVWVAIYGVRAGDEVTLSLDDPDGRPLVRHRRQIERNQARRVELAGRRRGAAPWPTGTYRAEVRVERQVAGGSPLIAARPLSITLAP